MSSSRKIQIFDTTLRDGEQVPGCQLNTEEKIIIAKELERLGVDIIEAGFPISSPGDFKSVVEVTKVIQSASVCALSRAVEKDIDAAAEALKFAKKPRIHTGIGVSDNHIQYKFNSTRDKIIEIADRAIRYAKKYVEDVEFFAEDAGRADNEFLARVVERVIKAGATVINIPDTNGYCLPEQYAEKVKYLLANVPHIDKVVISAHCHNDLGLATANAISAAIAGAKQIECTINGIGERAGNTALEEVVMVMKVHKHLNLHTDIKTEHIAAISSLVSQKMRMPIQPNKAVIGKNAFTHSSGIHQDGVIKNKTTYEIISPDSVGVNDHNIVLTARSGRAALKYKLEKLGFAITPEQLENVYKHFLIMADEKKEIMEEDLKTLVKNI